MIKIAFTEQAGPGSGARIYPVGAGEISAVQFPGLGDAEAGLARAAAAASRFDGEAGSVVELFVDAAASGSGRVLLMGTGERKPADMDKAGAKAIEKLLTSGETAAALILGGSPATAGTEALVRLIAALQLRSWRYDNYRTKLPEKQKPTLAGISIVGAPAGVADAWQSEAAVCAGVGFTRELVTEPANIIYPESFVERCQRLKELGVEMEVLGQAEMTKLGMGALLGVNQGSVREPQLLVMRWDGTGGKQERPVVLVGKGVCFDTGGISIKPAAGMEDMKWDMGGAGAVAGAMMALAGRKAKSHIVGVCGLVENMPDGNAQRPGDVVTSMSGQTVEVINTDAEGRLVLCDAMTWAQQRYKPEYLVDLATLTGAMIISLGNEHGGVFSNDDRLADTLIAAGTAAGDPLWRFPLGEAYDKLIDSQIADIKNVGPREAGSITAAQFLQRFVEPGVKWAHLDIAGMVWAAKAGGVWDKGATGYGVRLLNRFIADNFEA